MNPVEAPDPGPPRRYRLVLDGVTVAYGAVWNNNSATTKWLGDDGHMSFVVWPNIEIALARSFTNDGITNINPQVEWIDP